jgi:hypothetical protein
LFVCFELVSSVTMTYSCHKLLRLPVCCLSSPRDGYRGDVTSSRAAETDAVRCPESNDATPKV